MAFEPEKITKDHILKAIEKIKQEKLDLNPSTRWNVVINGQSFPPKEIMRYAHQEMNGEFLWTYGGGEATNKWLKQFDFKIVSKTENNDPVLGLIERYKEHALKSKLKDELYKWRLVKAFHGRPNPDSSDFTNEFLSINFANLIDGPRALASANLLAKNRPDDFCEAFKILFNEENKLEYRLSSFEKRCEAIHSEISHLPHRQDERTMATYLAFYDSSKYAFYKDSFYQKYCKLIGIKPEKRGKKLIHYLSLLEDFVENYILEDSELLNLKKQLLTDDCYEDLNHKIFAQDILYSTLDQQKGLGRNYWRVGTSDHKSNYWDIMQDNQYISIGWKEIGDLREKEVKNKKDIIQLLESEGYYLDDKKVGSRKAGEILNFYNDIKDGDIIIAQAGSDILGIGEVVDEYNYDSSQIFSHFKPVEWKLQSPNLKNIEGLRTTVYKISQLDFINKIDHLLKINKKEQKMINELNQILFGPPGTGKTYYTLNKALELCGEDLKGLSRADIKDRFEQLVDEGRIIFTTFHQSMTYEDFVEGIKPIEPEKEGDPVVYRVEEGIFRKLCIEASFSLAKEEESVATENVLDFSLAFDIFVQETEENLASGKSIELDTKNGGKVIVDGISQQGNIIIKHPGRDNTYPVSKQRLSKLHAAFPDLDDVNNIDQQFRSIIGGSNSTANWSVLNAIRNNTPVAKETPKEIRKYSWDDKVQVVKSLKKEDYKGKTGDPYVLIIDEINRGNVSQIFGELITLIEEDKRLGNPEAIQVQLPYSKEWFGVPPNVHIIGTMNTADRSVEALDTALRRRFSFTEMPPKPKIIKSEGKAVNGIINGIDLSDLLETINRRIEKLLNKDHMVGHSYFLSVKGLEELKAAFQNKIIPLLQEYFFGDYGKIGLVIGANFFEIEYNQIEDEFFAHFEDYDSGSLLERKVYYLRNVQDMDDDTFIQAINVLLRKTN
ncbi:AAA family ATPase [Echinicola marina]|uniref:McrB family protein n=1 Tax=Echinicola marina TaxID=2859768 RepID=UPI001CF6163E|nr:AAA family ATPase [Echinicola marina]UCS93775.1 AAA family ATPase [Echinicola marina]